MVRVEDCVQDVRDYIETYVLVLLCYVKLLFMIPSPFRLRPAPWAHDTV